MLDQAGVLIDLIRGELPTLWAGYGGGGGGDALPSTRFPTRNWKQNSDEKGGGGGGGGGGVRIRALGKIVFDGMGRVRSSAGHGGTGENTIFLDHVGGTGGSGSGGHVILESATQIDFTREGLNVGLTARRDILNAKGAPLFKGSPNSGNGGIAAPASHGGPGGPGVIQLHVPDPITPPSDDPLLSDIVVPTFALASATPLDFISTPVAMAMIPTFGARSQAQSDWISIGGADQSGSAAALQFLFGGVDMTSGKVLTTGSTVQELPALLGPADVPSAVATVDPDQVTLVLTGTALDPMRLGGGTFDDIYLRTPALLKDFVLRLEQTGNPTQFQDFNVVSASYVDDPVSFQLRIVVDGQAGTLQNFINQFASRYSLIPRFFRVVTNGVVDSLPADAFVRIRFEATGDDGFGNPNEANILVPLTGDVSQFGALPPGDLQFFRFVVDFDLDVMGLGVTRDTTPVSLEFLRLPLRF